MSIYESFSLFQRNVSRFHSYSKVLVQSPYFRESANRSYVSVTQMFSQDRFGWYGYSTASNIEEHIKNSN